MDIMKTKIVLQMLAKEKGVTLDEIVKEIDAAIDEARSCEDPLVQARWRLIPCKGEKPTAYEFIAFMRSLFYDE